ncbi:MAG: BlaI/MecI/CopY family transcriptional regulator [Pseudomonadales bacterium]|nr:BlaI/MecI/CopY family transcriptional regulator [Pseudomonadales bacterium]
MPERTPEVSKAEYQVLDVLWSDGELGVREIHDRLANDWAYSTTKTVVDRMARKGLLARSNQHGVYVYGAAISRPAGLARWFRFFTRQVLGVDTETAVAMFGQSNKIDANELAELERLVQQLDDAEDQGRRN